MRRLILSVDAGGVRSLAAASVFLKEVEDAFGKPARDVFDLFVGTSGGSLVATAAALGFTGDDLQNLGRALGSSAFSASLGHRIKTLNGYKGPKYEVKKLHDVLLGVFGDRPMSTVDRKLVVTATDTVDHRALFIKSHRGDFSGWPVAVSLTASCAAPFYFAPVSGRYADGGLHAYSPVLPAFGEAKSIFRGDPLTIISMGSGQASPGEPNSGNPLTVAKSLVGSVTSAGTDGDHWLLRQWVKDTESIDRLIRLEPMVQAPMDATDRANLDRIASAAQTESERNGEWRDFIEPWGYA
jgi:predicted acylesterase/phospholipase RssA